MAKSLVSLACALVYPCLCPCVFAHVCECVLCAFGVSLHFLLRMACYTSRYRLLSIFSTLMRFICACGLQDKHPPTRPLESGGCRPQKQQQQQQQAFEKDNTTNVGAATTTSACSKGNTGTADRDNATALQHPAAAAAYALLFRIASLPLVGHNAVLACARRAIRAVSSFFRQ